MKVLILDYSCGNIGCVNNIFSFLRSQVNILRIEEYKKINHSEYDIVVLPGVGNFKHASDYLHKNLNLYDFKKWLNLNKKVIAICLGFQLLFEESEETDGIELTAKGLGIIPGKIKSLSNTDKLSLNIGWIESEFRGKNTCNVNLQETLHKHYFYHMHSYGLEFKNDPKENFFDWYTISKHPQSEKSYISSIKYKNFFGFQFHPEKSGDNGLSLLKDIMNSGS